MHAPRFSPEFHRWTMTDGYVVSGRVFVPSSARYRQRQPVIIYLHGIQSHGGWYDWSASLLAEATQVPVIVPDRRGSGLNTVNRGDTPSSNQLLIDLDSLVVWAGEWLHANTVALVGVSWGGKLAAVYTASRRARVCGLLLIAPGVHAKVDVPFATKVRIVAALATNPTKTFPIPLNDPRLFTANPDAIRWLERDEPQLHEATARFLYASRQLDRQVRQLRPGALTAGINRLVLAGNDAIIDNAKTEAWARRVGPPATFEDGVIEPGMRIAKLPAAHHTMEFDANRSSFEAELCRWSTEIVQFAQRATKPRIHDTNLT